MARGDRQAYAAREVDDVEYPYGFASETEAVVRSVEGHLWILADRPDRAERSLRDALRIAGPSSSHAVDEIRVLLARATWMHGHDVEAINLLKERAAVDTASPELLRSLAGYLVADGSPSPDRRRASIELLRRAAADRSDSLRDMTVYNLAQQLAMEPGGEDEALELFQDLLRTRESHYSRAWYVFRMLGSWHWTHAVERHEAGSLADAQEEARNAAHWYGRAVRARPKVQIHWDRVRWQVVIRRIPPRPIMFANTADAHELAGHGWRAKYYFWREAGLRRDCARTAGGAMRAREWDKAYAFFDWAYVGAGDAMDMIVSVSASVAAEQRGDTVHADEQWSRAIRHAVSDLATSIRDQLHRDLDLDAA